MSKQNASFRSAFCSENNQCPTVIYSSEFFTTVARDREEPIPVSEFEAQVEQLHMGKNFDTEYMVCV